MDYDNIRAGIKTRLEAVSSPQAFVTVYDFVPDFLTPPCAIVVPSNNAITFHEAMGTVAAGLATCRFDIVIAAQRKPRNTKRLPSNSSDGVRSRSDTRRRSEKRYRHECTQLWTHNLRRCGILRRTVRFGGTRMSKYEVTSDNLSGHEKGDSVTDKQLAGANIEALIQGGHLKETNPTKKEK